MSPSLNRNHQAGYFLYKVVTICTLIAFLAGLLPPAIITTLPILAPQAVQAAAEAPAPEAQSPTSAATTPLEPALAQDGNAVEAVAAAPVAAPNASPLAQGGPASISGLVYSDFDADGVKDSAEVGVGGVTVTAYDATGAAIASTKASTTTATVGQYTLSSLPASTPLRLEFTTLPTSYQPSTHGSSNGTGVQFVTTSGGVLSNINFGVSDPADYYSQSNPLLASPTMYNGSGVGNTLAGLRSWSYNNAGSSPTPNNDADVQEIGAAWGLAWQRSTKRLYVGAFARRYAGFGPRGADGIYVVSYTTTPATVVGGFDLQGTTPVNGGPLIDLGTITRTNVAGAISAGVAGDYQLPASLTSQSRDLDSFGKVGKVSYGDLDLSEDEKTLWLVNLNQVTLISIDVSNFTPQTTVPAAAPGTINQYFINNLPGSPNCTNGAFRPFALKFKYGQGYLGGVCDATTSANAISADLKAVVLAFDPTNMNAGFTTVISFPLTYTREAANGATGVNTTTGDGRWHAWLDSWPTALLPETTNPRYEYAQPMLSDIEFTDNGSMVLAFRDRFGDQSGRYNYFPISGSSNVYSNNSAGDVLQLCNVDGAFVLEGQSGCPDNDTGTGTPGDLTNDGPGGSGEYYWHDHINISGVYHNEITIGALARLPGRNEIVSTVYDPINAFTQGIRAFNSTTGVTARSYEAVADTGLFNPTLFGKANGMGDLEILVDAAPLEIGNRVWLDTDADGIQDPSELPLVDVQVSRQGPTNTVTTVTDAEGRYYFSSLRANTTYTLTIDDQAGAYQLTTPNANAATDNNAITDMRDSDATLVNNKATIVYTTGGPGENNHSLDFGFADAPIYDLALIKTLAAGQAITVAAGAPVTFTLVVKNQGDFNSGTFTVRDQLPTGLTYVAASGTGFNACTQASGVVTCVYPAAGINPGQTVTITLRATVESAITNAPYRNWAEISVDSGSDIDSTPDTNTGSDTAAGAGAAPNDAVIDHNDINHAGAAYDQTAEDEDDNDYQDVIAVYDLALIKTLAAGQAITVTPSSPVTFTLVIKNQGTGNSGTFTVRDQLPTGLTYVSASGAGFNACTNASGVVTCVYPATGINAGQSVTITLRATAEAVPANAPYRNWAEISVDSGYDIDSTPDATSGSDTAAGTGTAPNDAVIDHNDINHAGAAYDQTSEDEDDNDYQDLVVNYDLALIKTLGAGQAIKVAPGGQVEFSLVVKNQGNTNSGTFTVRDQLPTGLTYVSASGAGFNACSASGQVVTCVYPATGLNPGQTAAITLRATVESVTANAPYRNWAEISADTGYDIDSTPDTNSGADTGTGTGTAPNDPVIDHNDIDHAGAAYDQPTEDEDDNDYQDVVPGVYDLALIKTLAAGQSMTVTGGAIVTFTLTVKNQGDVDSGAFTVRDQLPTGLTYVSATGNNFTCTNASGVVTCPYTGNLASGESATLTVAATVETTPNNSPYRNWAEISVDSGADVDSTPDTTTGTDTGAGTGTAPNDPVINHDDIDHAGAAYDERTEDEDDNDYQDVIVDYDLALIKTLAAGQVMTVTPGSPVTFTLIVKNQGNTNSGTFTVRDQLPTGLTYVSATGTGFNACSQSSGVVTCVYPAAGINPGQTVTITLRATVETPANNAPYRNWAEISADSGNDIDSTPDATSGTDTGPGVGTAPNDAVIDHNDINHAGAAYDQPTEDEDDNDYQDIVVHYDLALIKTLAPGQVMTVTPGAAVTFTLVVKNQGGINSGTFTVRDQLPTGLTYVSASGTGFNACSQSGGVVTCVYPAAGINPGQTVTITLRATVESAITNAPYRNWAEISADSGNDIDSTPDATSGTDTGVGVGSAPNDPVINHDDINHAGAAYDQPTEDEDDNDYQDLTAVYDLALIKTLAAGQVMTVTPGSPVTFTLVVKNQGTVNSGTFTVRDQLPTGLTYVSAAGAGFNACTQASGVVTCIYPATGINPGETVTVTLRATVEATPNSSAPYRNWAEISVDSGYDIDSTPDSTSGTDTGAGLGTAPNDAVINHDDINHAGAAYDQTSEDEDDNDYQDILVNYDLALIKTLAPGQVMTVTPGSPVTFTIVVKNQGGVNSGTFTVRDQLPTGLTYVSASGAGFNTCTNSSGVVTCVYPAAGINPGQTVTITLRANVETPANNAPYRNWAEISVDSGYDIDSTPDATSGTDTGAGLGTNPNDAVINHDDINHAGAAYDQPSEDEDDNDYQDIVVNYDLALIKTLAAGQTAITPGGPVTFTITVKNQGGVNSGTFTVRDQLPTGLTYVSASGAGFNACTQASGVVTCVYPAAGINPGQTVTVTLRATVEATPNNAPYRNWAEISVDSGNDIDSTPDTNSGTDTGAGVGTAPNDPVIDHDDINHAGAAYDQPTEDEDDNDYQDVDIVYDLALIKTLSAGQNITVTGGSPVTFTLIVKNQGNTNSGTFTVRDQLPTGLTYVAASGTGFNTCTNASGVVTCVYPAAGINPGQTVTITLNATVEANGVNAPYRNWAEISVDSGGDRDSTPDTTSGTDTGVGVGTAPNDAVINHDDIDHAGAAYDQTAEDEDDNDYQDINVVYDLALIKTLAPGQLMPVAPGATVDFLITVKNQGTAQSGVFTVRDQLPTGLTYVSGVGASFTCSAASQVVTCNYTGNLAPGASATIALRALVESATTNAPYRNWAEISIDSGPDIDSTPDTTSGTDTGAGLGTNPNDAVINHDDIDHAGATYDQTAEDEDDNDYQDVTVATTYDLALIKTLAAGQPMTVTPGAPVAFTIVVKNQGTLNSGAFTVRDQLPTGLTYVAATGSNFTCSAAGQVVTCTYTGNLAQGATATLTVNTLAEQEINYAPYRNWAEISSDSGNDSDSTPDTNTGQDASPGVGTAPNDAVINHDDIDHAGAAYDQRSEDEDDNDYAQVNVVTTVIDLALVKVATPTTLKAGDPVTYTLRIKNQGTVASGSYTVTDQLPTGFTFVTASNSGNHSSGVVTWASLPSLAPGATQELTLRATVPLATTFGDYTNWAEISQDSGVDEDSAPDTNTGQNTTQPNDPVIDRTNLSAVDIDMETGDEDDNDPATVTVSAFDLALVKIASPTTVLPGQPVTFTLRVQNQGDVAAGPFTVRDQLPTGTTFVTASDGGSASSGVVTWNLSGLAAGASKDLTLVLIAPLSAGYHTNWAEISADGAPVGYVDQDSTPDANTGHDTTVPNDLVIDRTSLTDAAIDVEPSDEDDNDLARFLVPGELPPGSGVLTVTKTVSGTGPSPFNITVTGPSGYLTVTTVSTTTPLVLTGLASGLYTVTEQTTGWTTTYSATTGVSTGSRAVVTLTRTITTPATTPGAISGNVFRDDDADGVDDGASEPGVAGVVVTAYDRNGITRGSATSAATGNYSFTPTGSGPYRLELTNLPAGYYPTKHGTGNGTSTQFVTTNGGATNINFGVNDPADYCQANPNLCTSVYLNGDTNTAAPTGTLVKFSYNSSGPSAISGLAPEVTSIATKSQIGSTWGLAYARSTKTLYAAAFLKRHVGLGPNGPGAIYAIDSNGASTMLFADLTALGANVGTVLSNSARGLGGPTQPNADPTTFDEIGKVGLGDIEISGDERTLYVVSLNDKTLYALNIPAGTLAGSYPIPDPGCTGGAWRPFATKAKNGVVYVGGVCDAQASQSKSNLSAHVYRLTLGSNTFTQVLSFSLNYPKGYVTDPARAGWYPWSSDYSVMCGSNDCIHPQPVLSDIEIDVDGSMILGFVDRNGHQLGPFNATPTGETEPRVYSSGDILRAYNNNGTFVLENNGTAGSITTAGANNNQGPGGGEFYDGDTGIDGPDMVGGGLALKPGSGEVATTAGDPVSNAGNGIDWLSNTTGAKLRGFDVYRGYMPYFHKASGLGDLELLCDSAPIEIGNRVWNDLNGNGVQDPGEPGINGVQVSLQGPTNTVTVNTSGDGNYYFSNLRSNTPYTMTINPAQSALSGLRLTVSNQQAVSGSTLSNDAILDTRDSDALLTNGTPVIFYTTGSAGQNNHGLDFGFTQPVSGRVTITNTGLPKGSLVIRKATTPIGSSQTFTVTSNVPGHASFTLRDGQSYTMTQVPIGTYMVTETLPSGWTQAAGTCINVNGVPSGTDAIQVSKNLTTTCTLLNTLQPTMSNVLTVTKTVNWNGNTPNVGQTFNITITGPSFPSGKADTISAGQTKVYTNVVGGVYIVTETSPGAGWVTTYSVASGVVTLSSAAITATTAGPISGNVFRDYNADGVDAGANEPGVAGVIVTAYDPNGVARGSATTDASGNYSFTPTASGPYRLELTNLPSSYYPTMHGTGNGTSAQFVTTNGGATNVNFGVNVPADYSQSNPTLVTPLYINGDGSGTPPLSGLVKFAYTSSGTTPAPTLLATQAQVGSTWGLAYARNTQTLYAAAFLKRHVGLGPNGLGAIYAVNSNGGTPTLFADLTALGVDVGTVLSNSARGLGAWNTTNSDPSTFDQVGKVGLGDLDISDDGQTIYVVNLNDKSLYLLDVASKTLRGKVAIPDPGCVGGEWRPFALKYYRNNLYIGGVCDAQSSQQQSNLRAVVYRYDGAAFTNVLSFPLTYPKGSPDQNCPTFTGWYPWVASLTGITLCAAAPGRYDHPSPVLTDLEFDSDGSMILGFFDRFGHQLGAQNLTPTGEREDNSAAGDILRAYNNNGVFVLENNGKAGSITTAGANNNQGPGGGEFYYQDTYTNAFGDAHLETSQGGLALLPGSQAVAIVSMDPVNINSGGVSYYSSNNGTATHRYQVFIRPSDPAYFNKANGLGDLEILLDPAPLEIGNRVWNDLNSNGVQDPGEPGLTNVTVSLQGPTNTVTTNTDANGLYYFTVSPNKAYTLTINPSQAPLSGLSLTQANLQAISGNPSSNDPFLDTRDSDAVTLNGKATILYTTGGAGQNNHGLDFGFTQPLSGQVTIGNTAPPKGSLVIRKATTPVGSSQTFTVTSNVPGHASFTLRGGESYTMTAIPVGVYAVTETLPAGWTQAASTCTNISTLGAIQVSKAVTTTCTLLNALQPTTSNVLTVTKTVNWNGNTPNPGQTFAITITGPSFPSGKADTISAGQTKVYTNVVAGVYIVTETSPGAGWVTTYSVPSGVVNLSTAAIAATTAGPISGNVFRDYNADGVDAGADEAGVAGVIVTTYDPNGVARGSATTDANGNYSFTPTGSGPYRLELTNLPVGSYPTAHGTGNGTSTQFVTTNGGASNVNFGVNVPADYGQSNPDLVTPLYTNGDTNSTAPTGALVKFAYNSTGTSPTPTTLATKAQVGSTWGVAYARSTKTLYAAAFLKRHVGLGPNGLGAIYAVNINGGTPTLFADLAALGANVGTVLSNSARGLGAPTSPNNDATTYAQVGKVGLGDIDISDDERTLYVVSLNDKTLYALNVPAGTLAGSYTIPDPGCTGGAWRPFATKFKNGAVYVGGVCDAQTSQSAANLHAYIYRFTPGPNTFTQVFTFPLNYTKGPAVSAVINGVPVCGGTNGWFAWIDTISAYCQVNGPNLLVIHPQPMLSDLEFDQDGSLILGFMDRQGHQLGNTNYGLSGTTTYATIIGGDILRAYNNQGTYVLESNATAGPIATAGANNGQGPGGGEFYFGENLGVHRETSVGGLAIKLGSGEVALTSMDPLAVTSGGIYWYSNTTGDSIRRYQVFSNATTVSTEYLGKANGLGDLELLADLPPIEIGNRVWNDLNSNGVQDPGEPGLANVTVSLQGPTNTVTTNTDANGLYYFTVSPNTAYTLTINPSQTPLNGLSLTQANLQAISGNPSSNDAILDTRDNDAVTVGGKATIFYTTGSAGQNNHGLDFGFTQPLRGQVDIHNKAPRMDLGDNPDRYNTVITNTGAAHIVIPGLFLGAAEDDEDDGQPTADADGDGADEDGVQFPTLKAGSSAIITVTATNTGTQPAILAGWIDFNGNGQFEASERVTTTVPAGTTNGVFMLPYAVPAAAVTDTYARFRLSTDPAVINPTGVALDGEVEDYPVTIVFTPPTQFGDRVWIESDSDGLANTGTIIPIAGIVITATHGATVYTTTTNSQGYYSFTVAAGTYTVTYGNVPSGYGVTMPSATPGGNTESGNAGSYAQTGNPDQSHANGTKVTLTEGQANWHVDFAFHGLVEIGNYVWKDNNGNGQQDSGEPGIPGVTVDLYDNSGKLVMCSLTPTVNLALNKPATQSSTDQGNDANRAVDGNTSGALGSGSVTHTNSDANAWWGVDLGAVNPLTNIVVWNRGDGVGDRLNNSYVFVSDAPFISKNFNATLNQAGVFAYHIVTAPATSVTIPVNRSGRYVRVQLAGTNFLSLAEVQVFGNPAFPVTTTTDATGHYTFTASSCVQPDTPYQVRIDTTQAPLTNLHLTTQNAGGVTSNDPTADDSDSDAATVTISNTLYARIALTSPVAGVNYSYDFGFAPDRGALIIRKATLPVGSSQPFTMTSNVPNHASFTLRDGGSYTMTGVLVGNYAVTETLPSGWMQVTSTCTNGSLLGAIQVTKEITTTCTILNALQPTTSNVLTVTKTVNWNGNTPNTSQPFAITITGPTFPGGKADTLTAGQTKVYTNVVAGVYTVTETSPGAGWVTTYSVPSGVVTFGTATPLTATTAGPISGKVYRDFNSNGQLDTAETENTAGLAGGRIAAYDSTGVIVGTATTDAAGNYSLTPTKPGPYRVELQTAPAGSYPTSHGAGNGTSTQFVTTNGGASDLNFGVNAPADYSQSNPPLVTNVYVSGNNVTDHSEPQGTLQQISYNASGTTPTPTTLARRDEIGSTWGLAWARQSQTLYSAAFLKRHTGLGTGLGASNPLGAIYQTNVTAHTSSLLVDLSTLGVDVGTIASDTTRGLTTPTAGSRDTDAFAKIMKIGLGDLDMSEDEKTLYVMSLKDQTVYAVDIASKSRVGAYPMGGLVACTGGAFRPFALKVYQGKVYAGGVCDAAVSQQRDDLMGYIYRLDGATFTLQLSIPLNYDRGTPNPSCANQQWNPWDDSFANLFAGSSCPGTGYFFHSQPVLSDIEFDTEGAMIIGFRDRTADQMGYLNYSPVNGDNTNYVYFSAGDILRACPNATGAFVLESNGSCGGKTTSSAGNGEGPGGGEYYGGDFYQTNHYETSNGGLAFLPGSGEIALTFMDPVFQTSGGTAMLSNQTGQKVRGFQFYAPFAAGYLGKANGTGDIELLLNPAPLEIGNRVWNDVNGNGVQDPNEPGLNGVQVSLQGPTNTVTVTTSGDGNYYFSNLRPQTSYTLTINPAQTALSTLQLTAANSQAISGSTVSNDPLLDTHDSDALLVNGKPTLVYTTGLAGQNNHGLDFGFTQPLQAQVTIHNKAPRMDLGDNPDRYNTVITNTGAAHVIVPGLFLGASEDDEDDGQPTVDADGDGADEDGVQFPTLKAGNTAVITVTATNTGTQPAILAGWLDFNGNGQFEATERVTTTVPAGTTNGLFYLTYNVPANAVSATYARFRLSTDPAVVNPTGVAVDGEVEDYPISIEGVVLVQFGDRVWLESDRDGLATSGVITPIAGLLITATNGTQIHVTTTNSQGYYSFTVDAGTYTVTYGSVPGNYGVVLPSSAPGGNRESGSAGSYREVGKPDQSHANYTTVTLIPGQANWHLDFAFHAPQVDLHLVKQVTPPVAASGATQTYTLVLTNNGPDPATSVQVRDRLPSSLIYQSATAQQGTYDANTSIWEVGTVAAGSSVTLTITVTIK